MGKVQTIVSSQEMVRMKAHEIAGEVERLFSNQAYLYVIMDDEVALGLYENGVFQIRLASDKRLMSIPWEYVREIAVFSENQELRLRCCGDEFRGRYRVDDAKQEQKTYIMDETQKLWGTMAGEFAGWSLLASLRGTRFWVPFPLGDSEKAEKAKNTKKAKSADNAEKAEKVEKTEKVEKAIGILVRRYMDFPDASEKVGLIHREDERFRGFCLWPQEGGEKDGL